MPDNPVQGMKDAVDRHFDAAVGSHVRAVTGAATNIGGRVMDAADRAMAWWRGDDSKPRRRTTDIRLPNEGRRRGRQRQRSR